MTANFFKSPTLSSRAKRGICFFLSLLTLFATGATSEPRRPKILGIAAVRILVADQKAADNFYSKVLSKDRPCIWCGHPKDDTYSVNSYQFVELMTRLRPESDNLISEIVFATDDLATMREYLVANKIEQIGYVSTNFLTVRDPEGHQISFTQVPAVEFTKEAEGAPLRLVHAGFIVRNSGATDHFYKDIMGFRPYWHGGMKDEQTDWVSLQVPNGTDWIEFMVSVPADADQHLRGIMNHIALGVPDIESAAFRIKKNGVTATEEPKIGRDGKWQLNVYDPDQTRVEFMEFTPVQKPCCSEFTGPHPKP